VSWADAYVKKLQAGETVRFRPRGGSMKGYVESGQLVTVEPYSSFYAISRGDIVLCRVAGHQYLHLVKQTDPVGKRVLIMNGSGRENGWAQADNVYGKCTRVEP
jgi:hypothetical protein